MDDRAADRDVACLAAFLALGLAVPLILALVDGAVGFGGIPGWWLP